jgi:threonine dehydratase
VTRGRELDGGKTTLRLEDVRAAAALLAGAVERTPCIHSRTLSEITGAEVVLKFENLQFTASFKERGALVRLHRLTPDERGAGVVAMSAGNHAQAVAHQAGRLGLHAVIVMPRSTPNVKVERTRRLGAEVLLRGDDLEEAHAFAVELGRERGLTFVHPYDDDDVIAGQGSVALEMLEDFPDLEVLVVPVGGGGLVAGCAVAAKAIRPGIEVVGVETELFPSMRRALEGARVECGRNSIAEGIAVKQPGSRTLPLVREHVDRILLVSESAIEAAVLLLLEIEKTVVEGAGAVGLAALQSHRAHFAGRKVGLVLSGGNIDLMILSSIIQRGLVRSRRLVRLVVQIPDLPGALARLTRILGDLGANIVEVQHNRTFTNLALRSTEVELVLQTLGPEHVREVLAALAAEKYQAQLGERAGLEGA